MIDKWISDRLTASSANTVPTACFCRSHVAKNNQILEICLATRGNQRWWRKAKIDLKTDTSSAVIQCIFASCHWKSRTEHSCPQSWWDRNRNECSDSAALFRHVAASPERPVPCVSTLPSCFDVSPLHITPIHRFSQTALSNLLIISLMLGHLPELDWTVSWMEAHSWTTAGSLHWCFLPALRILWGCFYCEMATQQLPYACNSLGFWR